MHLPASERLVAAQELLVELWSEGSRPSLRWLRDMQRRRLIPHLKLGRRVFFSPSAVREALGKLEVKARA